MAVCLRDSDCGLFAHFPVTHIDWRWETLGPALARVASLLPTLRQAYDLDKMTVTDSSNASNMKILTDVATVLEHTEFDTYSAVFLATLQLWRIALRSLRFVTATRIYGIRRSRSKNVQPSSKHRLVTRHASSKAAVVLGSCRRDSKRCLAKSLRRRHWSSNGHWLAFQNKSRPKF